MSGYLLRMWQGAVAGEVQAVLFWAWVYASGCCAWGAAYLLRIRRWPEVAGRLLALEQRPMFPAMTPAERTWRVEAAYEYEVDGRRYRGHRVSPWVILASGALRGVLECQRLGIRVDGERVRVIHHPTRHHRAFLVRPGRRGSASCWPWRCCRRCCTSPITGWGRAGAARRVCVVARFGVSCPPARRDAGREEGGDP